MLEFAPDVLTPPRHTTRPHPDADFRQAVSLNPSLFVFGRNRATPFQLKKILQGAGYGFGGQMPIGDVVDLDHGCQRATSQTRHTLDGKHAIGVGILTLPDLQNSRQGILNQLRTLHMAGRAVANTDNMTPHRLVPELGIEG